MGLRVEVEFEEAIDELDLSDRDECVEFLNEFLDGNLKSIKIVGLEKMEGVTV